MTVYVKRTGRFLARCRSVTLMTPHDMFPTPRAWAERSYDVQRWTEIRRGGHFLEWEEPQIVADDLFAWFADRT